MAKLTVECNSAAAQVFDNQITGALQANCNTGPRDVGGNAVLTTLQCQNNAMLVCWAATTLPTK